MRRILFLVFLCSLALAPIGVGSPTDGSWSDSKPIAAAEALTLTKSFRGGERACVIALSHSKNIANIRLEVYDANGGLVAEDNGVNSLAGEMTAVVWYPPRDGQYRIMVRNPGATPTKCYLAVK